MKKFTFFQAPFLSFYSGEFYRDVYTTWKGTCFGFLFLLMMACWAAFSITIQGALDDVAARYIPLVLDQVPVIEFKAGEASTPENRPYLIQDEEHDMLFAIVDTSGEYESLDDTDAKLLITKKDIIHEQNAFETRTYSLKEIEEFTLTREVMNDWVEKGRKWIVPFIYPFCVIGTFIYRLIQVLLYAALGMLFASWAGGQGDYLPYMRVSVMAITPCIILGTLLNSFSIAMPGRGFLFMMMALGYIFYATRCVFGTGQEPASTDNQGEI